MEEGGSKKKKNTHPWRVEKFHLVIITTINQWTNEHKSTSRLISPLLFVTRIIVTHLLPIWSVVLVQVNIVVHAHQHGNFLCKTRELARITHPLASSLTPCPHNNKPKKFHIHMQLSLRLHTSIYLYVVHIVTPHYTVTHTHTH